MKRALFCRALLVFISGSASVFAFAPFECVPFMWVGLAVLFVSIQAQPSSIALLLGFMFGWGQFLAGVSWIWNSLAENGLSPVISAISVGLFCAYLALYPALTAWIFRWRPLPRLLRAPVFAALWTLTEWLRGTLFTGFSWLDIGYVNAGVTWLDGFAPFIGVYGLTFLTVFSAVACAEAVLAFRNHYFSAASAIIMAFCWFPLGLLASHQSFTRPVGPIVPVSLIQGNLTMLEKWGPETLKYSQYLYLELTKKSRGRLVIWPETGIPRYLDNVEPEYIKTLLTYLFDHHKTMITGVSMRELTPYGETNRAFNSLALFDKAGMQYYHKRHLVPFGEYIPRPFRWIVDAFLPMSDFTSGHALDNNPLTLTAQGLQLAPTICYEDAFGEEILANARQSHVLINVSNLAWFGQHLALEQHFQISKLRALETQRPLLSSTNTGVTGAIDDRGYVIARLPNNVQNILEVQIQGREGETPYMRYGNWPVLVWCSLIVCLAFLARKR